MCMPPHVFAFCIVLAALASGIVVASQRIHKFAQEKFRRLLEPSRVHKPHLGHRSASRQLDRDSEGPVIVEVCVRAFVCFLLSTEEKTRMIPSTRYHPSIRGVSVARGSPVASSLCACVVDMYAVARPRTKRCRLHSSGTVFPPIAFLLGMLPFRSGRVNVGLCNRRAFFAKHACHGPTNCELVVIRPPT